MILKPAKMQWCHWLILCALFQVLYFAQGKSIKEALITKDKLLTSKFVAVETLCTKHTLMVSAKFQDPFKGMMYARGYPLECGIGGNSSQDLRLFLDVTGCGVKITDKVNKQVYEVQIYIQYDQHVQQAADEQIHVRCTPPDNILVSSNNAPKERGGRSRQWNPDSGWRPVSGPDNIRVSKLNASPPPTTTTLQPGSVHCWMDFVKGPGPAGKTVHDYLRVGEEVSMVIKIQQKSPLHTKVVSCLASDGSNDVQQELIDRNGCAVEETIMPELTEMRNKKTGLRLVYAPFPAFKFPDRENLHIRCMVLLCKEQCPQTSCNRTSSSRKRHAGNYTEVTEEAVTTEKSAMAEQPTGEVVNVLDVFNAVEVRAPGIDDNIATLDVEADTDVMYSPSSDDGLLCLTPSRLILACVILLGVIILSILMAIAVCVWTRQQKRGVKSKKHLPPNNTIYFPFNRPPESYS